MSTTFSPLTALAQVHIDTTHPSPGTTLVAVLGEVDLTTAPVLRGRLLGVLHDRTPAIVVIDLAGVTFLDCAGISALVAVRNAAIQSGYQMRVAHPRPIVGRVLELTGLLGVLTAPIDQPELAPPRSKHPARIAPEPATVSQPTEMMVAA